APHPRARPQAASAIFTIRPLRQAFLLLTSLLWMWQAGCQIHPAVQPAHPARFSATHRLLPRPGPAAISALKPGDRRNVFQFSWPFRHRKPENVPSVPGFYGTHSTIIGLRTGGGLRIRNISGMITRNKHPITQNASAKANMPDCFNRVPYINPCARAAASGEEEPPA